MIHQQDAFFSKTIQGPLVIAGPCSAESPEQMLEIAKGLKTIPGLKAIRAGLWKPRTRAGTFEGYGKEALPWLIEAGKSLGIPVATEVAKPEHVEWCLKAGIEVMWIGARTTVNPFYVQELAEAMKGSQIHVMIKNPIHPEINLWLGAIERFDRIGINSLAAIHRGYFSLNASPYRNEPGWELAISLREKLPDLPIFCDPSHIAGRRDLLSEICQTAMDLDLDGLMVETHNQPDLALSDSSQQIKPADLNTILRGLKIKNQLSDTSPISPEIQNLREAIDLIDEQLIELLASRVKKVEILATEKSDQNLALFQLKRWMEILETRRLKGQTLNLDASFIQEIFRMIHKNALNVQIASVKKRQKS